MQTATLDYAVPVVARRSTIARNLGVFVPAAVAVGAIVLLDRLGPRHPDLRRAIPYCIVGLPAAAAVVTYVLLRRWWRQLHVAARIRAALVVAAAGLFLALMAVVIFGN